MPQGHLWTCWPRTQRAHAIHTDHAGHTDYVQYCGHQRYKNLGWPGWGTGPRTLEAQLGWFLTEAVGPSRLQGEDSEGHGSYRSCRGGAPGTAVSVASSGGNVVKAMHVTPGWGGPSVLGAGITDVNRTRPLPSTCSEPQGEADGQSVMLQGDQFRNGGLYSSGGLSLLAPCHTRSPSPLSRS